MTYQEYKCEWIKKAKQKLGLLSRKIRDNINYGGCIDVQISVFNGVCSVFTFCGSEEDTMILMNYWGKKINLKV
jgi:hypothetical protein